MAHALSMSRETAYFKDIMEKYEFNITSQATESEVLDKTIYRYLLIAISYIFNMPNVL